MNRVVRYRLWILCVVALLAMESALCFVGQRSAPLTLLIAAVCLGLVLAIDLLIVTTPTDAIRLPAVRSVVFIVAGTVILIAAHVNMRQTIPTAGLLGVAMLAIVALLAVGFVRWSATPWWAVVLTWHPGFIGPLALPMQWTIALLSVVCIGVWATSPRRPELTP